MTKLLASSIPGFMPSRARSAAEWRIGGIVERPRFSRKPVGVDWGCTSGEDGSIVVGFFLAGIGDWREGAYVKNIPELGEAVMGIRGARGWADRLLTGGRLGAGTWYR